MSWQEELTGAAGKAVAAAGGSVVRVGRAQGRGAGMVIEAGLVLTSAHNLRGETTTLTFSDGRSVTGTVKAVDADGDLAVLAADTGPAAPVGWADGAGGAEAARPALGTPVFALAMPAGGTGVRVTFGTVSSVGRSFRGPQGRLISDGLEHTAPLGRGSSGGPLVDADGRLVAINTHRLGDGFYLALPANAGLRSRIEALGRGEAPARRRLGVALAPPHVARRLRSAVGLDDRDGVLIREVADDSPAAGAGLRRGDLIVAAGGQPVDSIDALLGAVDAVDGATLALTVVRASQELEIEVRFDG